MLKHVKTVTTHQNASHMRIVDLAACTNAAYVHTRQDDELNVNEQVRRGLDDHKHEEQQHKVQHVADGAAGPGRLDLAWPFLEVQHFRLGPSMHLRGQRRPVQVNRDGRIQVGISNWSDRFTVLTDRQLVGVDNTLLSDVTYPSIPWDEWWLGLEALLRRISVTTSSFTGVALIHGGGLYPAGGR
jgi:hypothetical protein